MRARRQIRYSKIGVKTSWGNQAHNFVRFKLFAWRLLIPERGENLLVLVSLSHIVLGGIVVRALPRWAVLTNAQERASYVNATRSVSLLKLIGLTLKGANISTLHRPIDVTKLPTHTQRFEKLGAVIELVELL